MTGPALRIRHADPAGDGAACAAIYAPSVRDSVVSFEQEPPSAAEMTERIERLSATHQWLVADDGGRAAGFAYAGPHRTRAAYRWAAEVSVYIDAEYRRQGVGRALYGTLFDLLRRQGLQVLCAGVTLPNPSSVGLHEGMGFEPVAVYPRIGWKAGGWHDVGWWELELVAAEESGGQEPPEPGPPPRLPDL
jgi:L-amino acid N-acyltransferase YncA